MTYRISGYASRFGERDLGGDIVRPGAFAASLLSLGGRLPMLYAHDTSDPVGAWTRMVEDRTGLRVEGELIPGAGADRVIALVRSGAVSGLSIGYRTRRATPTPTGRDLLDLDLFEVSLTAFPMLRSARLTTIDFPPTSPTERISA